jgi:hypothetical protein
MLQEVLIGVKVANWPLVKEGHVADFSVRRARQVPTAIVVIVLI